MNENKNKVNKAVEDTLKSLDDIERVEASPFMFTRIMQQMEEKGTSAATAQLGGLRLALFSLLLLLNAYTVFSAINSIQTSQRAAQLDLMAKEYGINNSSTADETYYFIQE